MCRCWIEASLYIRAATALQISRIGILLTGDPTLHFLNQADVGDEENRNSQLHPMVANIKMSVQLSETLILWESQVLLAMKGP